MMANPTSMEAEPAEVRVHAPRQQRPKSSVRSKEQAGKGHAARKLKRALIAKNLWGNVALLRRSHWGEPELILQQPLFPDLW
jgi:hypothetical protein